MNLYKNIPAYHDKEKKYYKYNYRHTKMIDK